MRIWDYKRIINGQKDLKNAFLIKAQLFVVAAASYSKNLLNIIGYNLPIYPVKGYSATLNILDNSLVSDVSITDSSHKMVFTKIGDKLRIAGTAEFNGFNYVKYTLSSINGISQCIGCFCN
mgnify:CR=1 FL=1